MFWWDPPHSYLLRPGVWLGASRVSVLKAVLIVWKGYRFHGQTYLCTMLAITSLCLRLSGCFLMSNMGGG